MAHQRCRVLQYIRLFVMTWDLGPCTSGAPAIAASGMRPASGYAHLWSTGSCSKTGLGATSNGMHNAEPKAEWPQRVMHSS